MIENPIVPPYSIFCPPLLSLSHDFSQYSSMCSKETTQNAPWCIYDISNHFWVVYNQDYTNCVTYLRLYKQLIECGPSMRGSRGWCQVERFRPPAPGKWKNIKFNTKIIENMPRTPSSRQTLWLYPRTPPSPYRKKVWNRALFKSVIWGHLDNQPHSIQAETVTSSVWLPFDQPKVTLRYEIEC